MKLLSILMAVMLLAIPAILADEPTDPVTVETGVGIGVGITPQNSCPEITDVDYFVHTWFDHDWDCGLDDCVEGLADLAMAAGWAGRSYAFEGEAIGFAVTVEDKDGIIDDCVKVAVTLDNGYDPIEAGCVLDSTESLKDEAGVEIHPEGIGHFTCLYTVEPAAGGTYDEYWISVAAEDRTCDVDPEAGCTDTAPGVISLFLNPAVSMTISSQDTFGFLYDEGGNAAVPYAGTTLYSPYFTVENTAQPNSGLYILLQMYGTDMWDYESSAALCPTSNILKIENVDYMASHLNVQQDWTVMEDNPNFPAYIFQTMPTFAGNFLGIGDDITMRLRLNIPTPCKGTFDDGGEIVFVGQVV
ncbi:MAG TPA: hypothetical protein ENL10_04830 [Candidatus Cloacimonetes bacterium]|nr:hypothetical protein [Candidatus Cloacimonadota bacterium]